MKMFISYLIAQLKRVRQLLPIMLVMTIVLGATILLMASILIQSEEEPSEKKTKVKVGLVGDIGDSYLGFGITALQNLDSSRFMIDFVSMTEEEAADGINNGSLNAYVIVPEGFVDSLLVGENRQATYVTSTGGIGLGSLIMNELVETISSFLTESQSAIYGTQQIMRIRKTEEFWTLTDSLYLRFLDYIMGRNGIYELDFLGFTGQLSFLEYYFCALLVLFLLFWGISASPVFIGRDRSMEALRISKGQGIFSQLLAEYIAYFVLMAGSLFVIMLFLSFGMQSLGNIGSIPVFYFKFLPVVILISAMQFMIFELAQNMVSGILLQFLCCLGLGYLSGCFYPISFFPESIRALQPYLPTGACVNYAGNCITKAGFVNEWTVMALYLIFFFAITYLARKKRQGGRR